MRYLWTPDALDALPRTEAVRLGLVRGSTYAQRLEEAKAAGFANPRLIIRIFRKEGALSTVLVDETPVTFDPGDMCYPINEDEWEVFIADEKTYCRASMDVWAVDRNSYTAPI